MKKELRFQVSKYEFGFLLSQNSPVSIIGFKNPIEGYLTEDIFPLIQEASISLLDKELICFDLSNQIKIKDNLEKIIRVITTAEHTLLVAHKLNSQKKEITRSFNFYGANMASLEEDINGSYLLREINSKEDLVFLITEPFLDNMFWAPDSKYFLISEADITLIHQVLEKSNLDEVKTLLDKARGDEQSKIHFFETLQTARIKFSLLEFESWKDPRKNRINGFSVITDERYIWLLELIDQVDKTVRVSKTTINDLKKKINSIVSALMGE